MRSRNIIVGQSDKNFDESDIGDHHIRVRAEAQDTISLGRQVSPLKTRQAESSDAVSLRKADFLAR